MSGVDCPPVSEIREFAKIRESFAKNPIEPIKSAASEEFAKKRQNFLNDNEAGRRCS
jgi:hypothetical protein